MKRKSVARILAVAIIVTLLVAITPTFALATKGTLSISVDPTAIVFDSAVADYTASPDAVTATITNTGDRDVSLLQPQSKIFIIGELTSPCLKAGESATFTIQPKLGLPVGTYRDFIKVVAGDSRYNFTWACIDVSFEVVPHTYLIDASPDTDFGTMSVDYAAAPEAGIVTVTNTGNSPVTLDQPTSTNFLIGELSATTLAPGEKATFTVQPILGLAVGEYSETIDITGNDCAYASVDVAFVVVNGPAITAAPDTLDFGSKIMDYAVAPDGQTVTITNTGEQVVTLDQPTSTNYDVGALSAETLAPGETATFTLQPKLGLAAGTYSETIAITGTGAFGGTVSDTVAASFTVAAHTYLLAAAPNLVFATLNAGYTAAPATQTVTLTNNGNTAITLTQPTSTEFALGTLSATTLEPGATATFTIQPKLGLAAGVHAGTITITGANGATASVTVTFTVKALDAVPGTGDGSTLVWFLLSGCSAVGLGTVTAIIKRKS